MTSDTKVFEMQENLADRVAERLQEMNFDMDGIEPVKKHQVHFVPSEKEEEGE